MAGREEEVDIDDIDLEKVIWDPRYRRAVIDRLNREAAETDRAPEVAPRREETGS